MSGGLAPPRISGRLLAGLLLLVALIGAIWLAARLVDRATGPADPVSMASASLTGLREQNRLSAFQASYVAVVTSTQSRMGLSARKTLIMPGTVRYEIDMAKLTAADVRWDAQKKTLSVRLPPVDLVGPAVDMAGIREYDGGGILLALTDAESALDSANRRAGQAELLKQARGAVPMRLARDAHRRAVEQSFALPLRAAGLDAKVSAFFADEGGSPVKTRWDVSRSLEDVMADRR